MRGDRFPEGVPGGRRGEGFEGVPRGENAAGSIVQPKVWERVSDQQLVARGAAIRYENRRFGSLLECLCDVLALMRRRRGARPDTR